MIISDTYKFVFIHIPKCAGSTVRENLAPYDQKTIAGGLKNHPEFGAFDYAHIPISILRKFFPGEYEKVRDYYSFAIMRDPFSRFPSSLRQQFGFHQKRKMTTMTKHELKNEVDIIVNLLLKHSTAEILPAELIHFQKQKSYIYDGDIRIINSVYHIGNVVDLLHDLEKKFDLHFRVEKKNKIVNKSPQVYKNDLIRILDQSTKKYRSVIFKYIPLEFKNYFVKRMYVRPNELDIFNSSYIKNFIETFYSEDLQL